jgi:acyl-CoA thioesterase I
MSPRNKNALGGLAGAAALVLAVLGPASAQVPASPDFLAPQPPVIPAAASAPAVQQTPARSAALQQTTTPVGCTAPSEFVQLDHPLPYTARRLASGKPLTIVAIGSSSTAGTGASSSATTYPSRLATELRKRYPGQDITVINRGVGGEETADMLGRFSADVLAAHPQLVLWQVGTNSVLRDHPLGPHAGLMRKGIAELKALDADVVLIDPQYAPRVLAKAETPAMNDLITATAKEENVGLFRRFAIMHYWFETQHRSFDGFISPDGLHMNDWGYACWAKLLSAAIAQAAAPPMASAAPPTPTH